MDTSDAMIFAKEIAPVFRQMIEDATSPLLDRIKQLEARPVPRDGVGVTDVVKAYDGEVLFLFSDGEKRSIGPILDGSPGRDAEPVDYERINLYVDEKVLSRPVPKDGKDADPVDYDRVAKAVDDMVRVAIMEAVPEPVDYNKINVYIDERVLTIQVPKDGKDAEPVDYDRVKGIVDDRVLEAVAGVSPEPIDYDKINLYIDERVSTIEAPPGEPGADAEPVDYEKVREIVAEAVAGVEPDHVDYDRIDRAVDEKVGKAVDVMVGSVELSLSTIDKKISEEVAKIPPGEPGKSVDMEEVGVMVIEEVERAVAALPKPKDGEDADPQEVAKAVAEEVEERIKSVEGDVARLSEAVAGVRDSIPNPSDLALAAHEVLKVEVDKAVALVVPDAVSSYAEAHPPERGPPGPSGKDGVGVAGGVIDQGGHLKLSMTDGSLFDMGLTRGERGPPGEQGFSLSDLSFEQVGRSVFIRFERGDLKKEVELIVPSVIYCGVWKEGRTYEAGDAATWGGSLFVASESTVEKPGTGKEWLLAVKRGRDGKDGKNPLVGPPKPVKVGS
jgi:hypothetical protein